MDGKDLTKGNLFKNMFILLIPLILTNLLNSLYNIVDGIFIGNLIGEEGVSAIANCSPIIFIITALIQGPSIATSVLISQYFGAKKDEEIKRVCGVSYIVTTLVGIVSALVIIVTADFWLKILNTPKEIFIMTKQYIIIY
jgi:Na+-driven multidrug efflux pump